MLAPGKVWVYEQRIVFSSSWLRFIPADVAGIREKGMAWGICFVHPRKRRGNTLPCPLGKAPGCLDTGAGWEFHDKGRVWSAADESPRSSLPAILAAWSSAKGESRSGSGVGTKIRSGSSVKN